jgi:hypothetical protein
MPSLESLLHEANQRGWQVHNLYQENHTKWHCRLKHDNVILFAYGEGDSPSAATMAALSDTARAISWQPQLFSKKPKPPAPQKSTTDDLLEDLI